HSVEKKLVGPAFRDVAAKYKDDAQAEGKLVAALKEGKGHPLKVEAADAEIAAMVKQVLAAAPAAKSAVSAAAAKPAAPAEKPLTNPQNATCLGCHATQGFQPHVDKDKFEASVHAPRNCTDCHRDI